MIESRCGLLCSQCDFRAQMKCNSCLKITQAFWGKCPVKTCCEDKKLLNCGLCHDFPCNLLNDFSYDKEQGDNGKRIEQCKQWAENK